MSESPIRKAAGIIIVNRRAVVTRSYGKDVFVPPGGKLKYGETEEQALIRELREELGITVYETDLEKFGDFEAIAAGHVDKPLIMVVYFVRKYIGDMSPQEEIEELRMISSVIPENMEIGSIFLHDVLPRLKAENLID